MYTELIIEGAGGTFCISRYSVFCDTPFAITMNGSVIRCTFTPSSDRAEDCVTRKLWKHELKRSTTNIETLRCTGAVYVKMELGQIPDKIKTPLVFAKNLHVTTSDCARLMWGLESNVSFQTIHVNQLDSSEILGLSGKHIVHVGSSNQEEVK